jgi:hypothetical protein
MLHFIATRHFSILGSFCPRASQLCLVLSALYIPLWFITTYAARENVEVACS